MQVINNERIKNTTRTREKMAYKLNGQEYKYNISSHKESKF